MPPRLITTYNESEHGREIHAICLGRGWWDTVHRNHNTWYRDDGYQCHPLYFYTYDDVRNNAIEGVSDIRYATSNQFTRVVTYA